MHEILRRYLRMKKNSALFSWIVGILLISGAQSQGQILGSRFAGVDVPPPLKAQNVQDTD